MDSCNRYSKKFREYLNLWAIGTILVSTQMVDMKTTRKSNYGRIFVAVLDPKLLPSQLDVVIGDHYFELKFEVERVGCDEHGDEVEWGFLGNNDEGSEDMEEDKSNDYHVMDREPKRSKTDNVSREGDNNGKGAAQDAPSDNNVVLEAKLQSMANEILDKTFENIINQCCDKVLAENEDELQEGLVEDVLSEDEEMEDCFTVWRGNGVQNCVLSGTEQLSRAPVELSSGIAASVAAKLVAKPTTVTNLIANAGISKTTAAVVEPTHVVLPAAATNVVARAMPMVAAQAQAIAALARHAHGEQATESMCAPQHAHAAAGLQAMTAGAIAGLVGLAVQGTATKPAMAHMSPGR